MTIDDLAKIRAAEAALKQAHADAGSTTPERTLVLEQPGAVTGFVRGNGKTVEWPVIYLKPEAARA